MVKRSEDPAHLDRCFGVLVRAAVAGVRCPEGDSGAPADLTSALARAGRIRVEISGRNYRQVFILEGEHDGKATAPNPHASHSVWKVIQKGTPVFKHRDWSTGIAR